MWTSSNTFIPQASSEAGSCLTSADWQEVGIDTLSFTLEDLLLKPGYPSLLQITDLKKFLAWSGRVVINAANMTPNREGVFTVVSPYDGSKVKINSEQLFQLIIHLKPDAFIVPAKLDFHGSDSIFCFISVEDIERNKPSQACGVYFQNSDSRFSDWSEYPRYFCDASAENLSMLSQEQGVHLESNQPARDAVVGRIYSQDSLVDLQNSDYALTFKLLDDNCSCPTCKQQFTQAYLHHLLAQTPLLCQRFLIQHNINHILSRKTFE